jgi:hypothetical protein
MALIDAIERGTFFRLTRIVAFLWLFLLIAGSILSVFLFFAAMNRSVGHVAPELTLPASETNAAGGTAGNAHLGENSNASPLTSLRVPLTVQSYLDDEENKKVVEGWLELLDPSDRQDFLDNMAEVITAAEKQRADVVTAINRYKELKLAKIAAAKQGPDFMGISIRPLDVLIGIFVQLALIALVSLVLVLLAIERNTRKLESGA